MMMSSLNHSQGLFINDRDNGDKNDHQVTVKLTHHPIIDMEEGYCGDDGQRKKEETEHHNGITTVISTRLIIEDSSKNDANVSSFAEEEADHHPLSLSPSEIDDHGYDDYEEVLKDEGSKSPLGMKLRPSSSNNGNDSMSCASSVSFESVSKFALKNHRKLFGDDYTAKEGLYVVIAGSLIAFNTGYVNGSCLSGLLSPNGIKQSVAGFSGTYTKSGLALAQGEFGDFFYNSNMILSYMFGSFISGFLTPNETPYRIEPTYGPTYLIGGIFLLISSIFAAFEFQERYIFFFAAAASGIQNGIASIYSKNLIRCSLTGASTDIAIFIGQMLRGNRKKLPKGIVMALIVASFWFGGLISFYATSRFRTYSLFVNAILFWLIGMSLVWFLVTELDVTVRAALLGSWEWKQTIKKLHNQMLRESNHLSVDQSGHGNGNSGGVDLNGIATIDYDALFDRIDVDGNGYLEEDEMLEALQNAGMKFSIRRIKALIKAADIDNDGTIDRDEWKQVCANL